MKEFYKFTLFVLVAILPFMGFQNSKIETSKTGYAIGIVNRNKKENCSVSELVIDKEIEVTSTSQSYNETKQQLLKDYPRQSQGVNRVLEPTVGVVPPGKVVIIYSYKSKKPSGCESYTINYVIASSFESASKILEGKITALEKECKVLEEKCGFKEIKRWPTVKIN